MSRTRTLPPDQSTSRTPVAAAQPIVPLAYRTDDAAALIGVSSSKVWSLIREGRLPARKLDGSTIIRHDDLIAFVDGLPLVRQSADPPAMALPVPPPPFPKTLPPPPPTPPPAQDEPPPHLRRVYGRPRYTAPLPSTGRPLGPPPSPTSTDKRAPYGRGRTGKPLPPPNPNGWGLRTLRQPSPALAAIVGSDPISRPRALEKIWKHIHAGGLQRECDLRVIYADEKLRAVVGTEVITMYALEALIRSHLEPII